MVTKTHTSTLMKGGVTLPPRVEQTSIENRTTSLQKMVQNTGAKVPTFEKRFPAAALPTISSSDDEHQEQCSPALRSAGWHKGARAGGRCISLSVVRMFAWFKCNVDNTTAFQIHLPPCQN
jgi:hypothetical protein